MYLKIGLVFIVFGVIYIVKPDLYKVGIWTKTSIAQRLFKPENYLKYMKILGVLFIVLGIGVIIYGLFSLHH